LLFELGDQSKEQCFPISLICTMITAQVYLVINIQGCLVVYFEHFKHTYTYFYTLFHLYVYQKYLLNNITQTPLPNHPNQLLYYFVECFLKWNFISILVNHGPLKMLICR